jgi:catechol 2,3-dioxygenase-like lactoylglutathione lyase family enzyme
MEKGHYSAMLADNEAFSSFSVPDLQKAREFYGQTLGLQVNESPEGLELQLHGGGRVFIYPSDTNKPADFTVLNFIVDDVEKTVADLAAKGVRMEQYDMPEAGIKTDAKGIARNEDGPGPQAMAWFKDPAGNILALMQEK